MITVPNCIQLEGQLNKDARFLGRRGFVCGPDGWEQGKQEYNMKLGGRVFDHGLNLLVSWNFLETGQI